MNIDYSYDKCPHCSSEKYKVLGNNDEVFGLVSIKQNNVVDLNTLLPVMPIVCLNCGHIELIHINVDMISKN